MMENSGNNKSSRHKNSSVLYFGFFGMIVMVFLNAFLPDPKSIPNPIVLLNVWTISGLISYLICWPLAFYQLLVRQNMGGIADLGIVSALYCITFLIYAYNPLVMAGIFVVILCFLMFVQAPASPFRRKLQKNME